MNSVEFKRFIPKRSVLKAEEEEAAAEDIH